MKKSKKIKTSEPKPDAERPENTVPQIFIPSEIERHGKRAADGVILPPGADPLRDFGPIPISYQLTVACLPAISQHFYLGNDFLQVNEHTTALELFELSMDLGDTERDAILPVLREKIESLLGEGNFMPWDCEITEHISLNWLVDSTVYNKAVKLISEWLKYEEIDSIVTLEVMPIDDEY